jgi:uncharacterized protein
MLRCVPIQAALEESSIVNCPKCTGILQQEEYGDDIAIHRCDSCAGLWCKPAAIEAMKKTWMSEAVLDTGSPKVGQKLNEVSEILCPEGHGKMDHCHDARQRHITYESCPVCLGVFLDAGEFTDLKYDTLLDKVRSLLV